MSWASYIDNLIVQSQDSNGKAHVDRACIIGLASGGFWTSNYGSVNALRLTPAEGSTIAEQFKRNDTTSFVEQGVKAEGIMYQFINSDDDDDVLVVAKNECHGYITLLRTKAAVAIAHTPEGGLAGNAIKGVRVIAEYLESQGM